MAKVKAIAVNGMMEPKHVPQAKSVALLGVAMGLKRKLTRLTKAERLEVKTAAEMIRDAHPTANITRVNFPVIICLDGSLRVVSRTPLPGSQVVKGTEIPMEINVLFFERQEFVTPRKEITCVRCDIPDDHLSVNLLQRIAGTPVKHPPVRTHAVAANRISRVISKTRMSKAVSKHVFSKLRKSMAR